MSKISKNYQPVANTSHGMNYNIIIASPLFNFILSGYTVLINY